MKTMTVQEAQGAVQACYEFGNHLADARKTLENEAAILRVKQEELKARHPRVLAAEVLGEIGEEEVTSLEEEIATVERRREVIPLVLKGIRDRETENNTQHAKALNRLHRLRAAVAFEEAVAKLNDNYDRELEETVRQLGHELGRVNDGHPL